MRQAWSVSMNKDTGSCPAELVVLWTTVILFGVFLVSSPLVAQQPCEVLIIVIPLSQVRKWRHREVKQLAQGPIACSSRAPLSECGAPALNLYPPLMLITECIAVIAKHYP